MPIITTDKPLRKRSRSDFYPTPHGMAQAALDLLPEDFSPRFIFDPGHGTGVWGQAVRKKWGEEVFLSGIDIMEFSAPDIYDVTLTGDYLSINCGDYNLIVGNPPFSLAEEFIRKSVKSLLDGGYVMFLLRLSFLESQKRGLGLYKEFMPWQVITSSRRPSFTGNGRTDSDGYGIFIWKKGWDRDYYIGKMFYWDYLPEDTYESIQHKTERDSVS